MTLHMVFLKHLLHDISLPFSFFFYVTHDCRGQIEDLVLRLTESESR